MPFVGVTWQSEDDDGARGRGRDRQRSRRPRDQVSPPPVRPQRRDFPGLSSRDYFNMLWRYLDEKDDYDVRHGVSLSPSPIRGNVLGDRSRSRSPLHHQPWGQNVVRRNTVVTKCRHVRWEGGEDDGERGRYRVRQRVSLVSREISPPPIPPSPRGTCGTVYIRAYRKYLEEKRDYELRHGVSLPVMHQPSSPPPSSRTHCRKPPYKIPRKPLSGSSGKRSPSGGCSGYRSPLQKLELYYSRNTQRHDLSYSMRHSSPGSVSPCGHGSARWARVSSPSIMAHLNDQREAVLDYETLLVQELTELLRNITTETPDRNRVIDFEQKKLSELRRLIMIDPLV